MKENNLNCSHTSYDIIGKDNKVLAHRTARIFKSFEELLKSCD